MATSWAYTELEPCGTLAAARRHYRYGEPVCRDCRQAERRDGYDRRHSLKPPRSGFRWNRTRELIVMEYKLDTTLSYSEMGRRVGVDRSTVRNVLQRWEAAGKPTPPVIDG